MTKATALTAQNLYLRERSLIQAPMLLLSVSLRSLLAKCQQYASVNSQGLDANQYSGALVFHYGWHIEERSCTGCGLCRQGFLALPAVQRHLPQHLAEIGWFVTPALGLWPQAAR